MLLNKLEPSGIKQITPGLCNTMINTRCLLARCPPAPPASPGQENQRSLRKLDPPVLRSQLFVEVRVSANVFQLIAFYCKYLVKLHRSYPPCARDPGGTSRTFLETNLNVAYVTTQDSCFLPSLFRFGRRSPPCPRPLGFSRSEAGRRGFLCNSGLPGDPGRRGQR